MNSPPEVFAIRPLKYTAPLALGIVDQASV